MTYKQFVGKYLGKGINFDNHYGNQCMDVYRQYCKEVLKIPQSPGVKGAKNIWDTYLKKHFVRVENTPAEVPREGNIVIWEMGTYGHVGIFDNGDVNKFESFDQNYPVGSKCHLQKHSYKDVLGWLVYNQPEEPPMTKDETNALKVIKKYKEEADHGNLEGAANAAIGAAKDLLTARGLLKTSEGLRKSAEKLTKTLNGKLTSEMAGKDLLAVKLKTANNKVERLIAEKETETGLKNQYRRWWEKRKNHDIRDMGTWKIIVHLFTKVKIGKKVDVKKK